MTKDNKRRKKWDVQQLKEQIELVSYNPMMAGKYIKKDRAIKIVEEGGIE